MQEQTHPSKELHKTQDFIKATVLYVAQFEYEADLIDDELMAMGAETPETAAIADATMIANEARAIYYREMEEAKKRTVAELRSIGLEEFADALETGDYSKLAI